MKIKCLMLLKNYLLVLAFLILHYPNTSKADPNFFVGIGQEFILTDFKERPNTLQNIDTDPALNLMGGIHLNYSKSTIDINFDLLFLDSSTQIYTLDLFLEAKAPFLDQLKLGVGHEILISSFGDDSTMNNTVFDHKRLGLFVKATYLLDQYQFYLALHLRKTLETSISKQESIRTKISYDIDKIIKLGSSYKWSDLLLLFEFRHYLLGKAQILSQEFSYEIEQTSRNAITIGTKYYFRDFEIAVNYYQFINDDDEISLFYQSPHFAPEYGLAKKSLQLEFIWNF